MLSLTTLTCRMLDGTVHRLDLHRHLGPVRHGDRFSAADASSLYEGDATRPDAPPLSVELLEFPDAAHRERYEALFEAMRLLSPHLHRIGEVVEGPRAGAVVVVTEAWGVVLGEYLGRPEVKLLADSDLGNLFVNVVDLLFRLHETGRAHGDVQPGTIAWVDGRGWCLMPGHPARGSEVSFEADVLAFGRVLQAALGLTPLPGTPAPRRPWWLLRLFGLGRPPAPAPAPELPAGWRMILDGCLEADAGRRWTAQRLRFGQYEPPVVRDLRAVPQTAAATDFDVSWPAFPVGEPGRVVLFNRTDLPTLPLGRITGWLALQREWGAALPGVGTTTGRVQLPPNQDLRTVQAVTVREDIDVAVAGAVIHLTHVPDVTDLCVHPGHGALFLSWVWPDPVPPMNVSVVTVAVRTDRYPTSPEDADYRLECVSSRYEVDGRFELPLRSAVERIFVVVFSQWRTAAGPAYSPGARLDCRWQGVGGCRVVDYRVPRPCAVGRGCLLELSAAEPLVLPPLVLVGSFDNQPLGRNSGQPLGPPIGGQRLAAGEKLLVPFERPPRREPLYLRLFCQRDEDYTWLQLHSDPPDGIVLR